MKVYLVGGAVRDMLMGRESKDRDYVVVGSTEEEMLSLGYTKVGAAFPVFLHPETKEEYALARTERSTGPGYHDFETIFTPDVTLEEDLKRRDLTMNAIAFDEESGTFIDPHNGYQDIINKQLVAVSEKTFEEDPLRIYRLARLYARFGGEFTIPVSTLRHSRNAGWNLDHLPKERKFAEIEKCFNDKSPTNKPSLMITFLSLIDELPEVAALEGVPQPPAHHPEGDAFVHTMLVIDAAHKIGYDAKHVWAALCHDLGKATAYNTHGVLHGHEEMGVPLAEALSDRFGAPVQWKKLAVTVARNHGRVHKIMEATPKKVYDLLAELKMEQCLDTLEDLATVCRADAWGRGPTRYGMDYQQGEFLFSVAVAFLRRKPEIKKECQEIALKWKDNHAMLASEIRAMKIAHVREIMRGLK